ncbi:MAG: tetratricopeptide repeat protein [Phycisphaerae bacterium]|nr:tetratricopeptide repeat protein [Phycisphaerae bacterium]
MQDAIRHAVSLAQSGSLPEAIRVLQAALPAAPGAAIPGGGGGGGGAGEAEARALLGTLLHAAGRATEAIEALRQAHALAPAQARIAYQLGVILIGVGRLSDGLAMLQRAADADPAWPMPLSAMARTLAGAGDPAQADRLYRRALALNPADAESLCGLGGLLITSGKPAEAVEQFRAAARAAPTSAEVLGKVLSALNYADDATPEETFDAHRRWGQVAMASALAPPAFANPRDPLRRLRVGLLSPDLYDHSCAYFLLPILEQRDRAAVEYVCYSVSDRSDAMTARLRSAADHWRDAAGWPGSRLVRAIREDSVDVLVELSAHTAGGPLAALKDRAAPVQVTYLGYPNTTGLPTIDARLVDSRTDPPGAERFHTERLLRLDPCFLCYAPPAHAPPVSPPPALGATGITFASFNSIRKLSPTTLRMWARTLGAVPGSRLLLKTRGLAIPWTRENILSTLAALGVGPDRVEALDLLPDKSSHLDTYARADIALDTFPYNGTTTTCEALWMGVPVVTREGATHAARVGASLLAAAGLPVLVARDEDEFARIASGLARDLDRLASLRAGMRARLAASALLDAPAFARRFEHALRAAWSHWCGQ